jgi:hypothetical protein
MTVATRHAAALVALLCAAACSDAGSSSDSDAGVADRDGSGIDDADTGGGSGEVGDTDAPGDAAAGDVGEGDLDPGPIGPCGPIGRPRMLAVHTLLFAKEDTPGQARGFDIDTTTTRAGDRTGCGKPDFTSPDGTPGIDNQFARLLPALDAATGEPTDGSLERAIREAELILLIEMESLDDAANDDCVSLNIYRGTSDVAFGTDGRLLAGQSYDIDTGRPWFRIEDATVRDGVLRAGPFRLELPLTFFSTNLTVVLERTWIEATLLPDGSAVGVLGGAANVLDLLQTAADVDPSFVGIATGLLGSSADLDPDASGKCQAISIAWEFEAGTAHLYPDTVRPSAAE